MSALTLAEGVPEEGRVVTLECYENVELYRVLRVLTQAPRAGWHHPRR